jgi:hypothetical protein
MEEKSFIHNRGRPGSEIGRRMPAYLLRAEEDLDFDSFVPFDFGETRVAGSRSEGVAFDFAGNFLLVLLGAPACADDGSAARAATTPPATAPIAAPIGPRNDPAAAPAAAPPAIVRLD